MPGGSKILVSKLSVTQEGSQGMTVGHGQMDIDQAADQFRGTGKIYHVITAQASGELAILVFAESFNQDFAHFSY